MRSVTVLLDTGSELSFVEESFAQELALPIKENSSLNIGTFSSPTPIPKICGITELTLCDIEGMQHHLRLHRNDFLTGTIEQAGLDQADSPFIKKHGIVLSLPTIQQARYEYANLLQGRSNVYNRRGGVYHYLVMVKQLNAKHTEQKRYEILVTVVRNPRDCRGSRGGGPSTVLPFRQRTKILRAFNARGQKVPEPEGISPLIRLDRGRHHDSLPTV
ncbi:unnamed protein product [Nippostrongylus brasiliensis]|uniref:Peptidase A2 domain-containing protein n=1 Tax=Nippostrongylus brasiliensis TaxID=27835 RepID=A0A0N4XWH0_NIPBR|nr:unnamed protein product [Nippostrongylus brasiliensis]